MTAATVSVQADAEPDPQPDTRTRHARALAALRSAEARTGVREQTTPQTVQPRVRALRGGLADDAPGAAARTRADDGRAARAGLAADQDGRVLPVHPHLTHLLPDGGLRAGTTVVVRGSASLLLALLAEASCDGAWTVLVGYPSAGIAAAADAGCDLERTLVVPLPAGSAVDAPAVLAALIDGMDVVVIGPEVTLLDHDRRRLAARARDRGTVLLPSAPGHSR
nr:hypothetical protein GCM10025730_07850 [Promicromonospora thailandica]